MALPSTGPITLQMIADELGISATGLTLNNSAVRALAGKPSGPISMGDLRGKSASITMTAGLVLTGTSVTIATYGFDTSVYYPIGSISGQLPAPLNVLTRLVDTGAGTMQGSITFAGDVVSSLTGKSIYINGVQHAMGTPTFGGTNTTWQRTPANTKFGFVKDGIYTVSIR